MMVLNSIFQLGDMNDGAQLNISVGGHELWCSTQYLSWRTQMMVLNSIFKLGDMNDGFQLNIQVVWMLLIFWEHPQFKGGIKKIGTGK